MNIDRLRMVVVTYAQGSHTYKRVDIWNTSHIYHDSESSWYVSSLDGDRFWIPR